MNYVIHLAFGGSEDEANRHTDREFCNISSIMLCFMGNKVLYNVKDNIAILFLCPVSVAYKFLMRVTECYKCRCEHSDDPGGHSLKKVVDMRNFVVWAILLAGRILCTSRSWTNVKI
jgi:hypothetical protein